MTPESRSAERRSLWAGVLLALSVFTIVDETVLHLILHWHHFYDRSTLGISLMADGLFQAVGLIALVGGAYLTADLRRTGSWRPTWQATGFVFGLGLIGLVDEILVHKVLRWHQIHYGPELWKYDAVAGLCIVVSLLIGAWFLIRARKQRSQGTG